MKTPEIRNADGRYTAYGLSLGHTEKKSNGDLLITLQQLPDRFYCVRIHNQKTLQPFLYREFTQLESARSLFDSIVPDWLFVSHGAVIEAPLDNENDIIHASLNIKDVMPALLNALRFTPEYAEWQKESPKDNPYIHNYRDEEHAMWKLDDEYIYIFLEEIINTLDKYAPEGWVFGSHVGNDSAIGYWKLDEGEML